MTPAVCIGIAVLLMEIRAQYLCIPGRGWKLLIFFTQLSNYMTCISTAALLIATASPLVTALRYLAVCMMVMTFLVTTCVLVPMGGDPKELLWTEPGIYLHIFCPVLTVLSYFLFEHHAGWNLFWLPVTVTLVYGLVMLLLNASRKVDGPYPFFKVHNQSAAATVMWILILTGVISGTAALVILLSA